MIVPEGIYKAFDIIGDEFIKRNIAAKIGITRAPSIGTIALVANNVKIIPTFVLDLRVNSGDIQAARILIMNILHQNVSSQDMKTFVESIEPEGGVIL